MPRRPIPMSSEVPSGGGINASTLNHVNLKPPDGLKSNSAIELLSQRSLSHFLTALPTLIPFYL